MAGVLSTEDDGAKAAPQAAQIAVRDSILSGAKLSSPYLIMNMFATIVAGYGLLANSAAVVIGAMIIAMLLGPIMGLALALVDGDTSLLRQAFIAEVIGATLVLLIGFVLGKLHSDIQLSSEILARTKPNLLDLMVALAGGAAGAYATVSPKLAVGIVGVAISTALVPPLTSCGICLAHGFPELAAGAFVLFLTNLVAIQCSSSAVLFAFGFHQITTREKGDRSYLYRLIVDAALLVTLSVFLFIQLSRSVSQQAFEIRVKASLQKNLKQIAGAYLAETRFVEEMDSDVIVAVVRVPNSITPEQTAKLQSQITPRDSKRIELHVRSLLTKETTEEGYLHEIAPSASPIENAIPSHIDPPATNAKAREEMLGRETTNEQNPLDRNGQF